MEFTEILTDSLFDTLNIAPLLLAVYVVIELVEYKFGGQIIALVKKAGRFGPLAGALAGIFPQCGFSVIATALYTQRLVTLGTLLAVYLSTSDEAIPIILSQPDKAGLVLPLVATKLGIALAAGFIIDAVFSGRKNQVISHIFAIERGKDDKTHHHETVIEEKACCGHSTDAHAKRFASVQILAHPLVHTVKILFFIFGASLIIGGAMDVIGQEALARFFMVNKLLAPAVAALIGLIPNCAASVAITQMYLANIIGYGAAIAGLCASAGLGILLLFKEEKNKRDALLVISLLLCISIAAGVFIEAIV